MKTSIDIRRDFPGTKTETRGKAGLYTCKATRDDIGEIVGYGCTLAGAEDTAWYGVKITLRDK